MSLALEQIRALCDGFRDWGDCLWGGEGATRRGRKEMHASRYTGSLISMTDINHCLDRRIRDNG
ncbi:hypothetical protein K0M31_000807 [Melipona bicolor]|uniref:Uncharacterized protein n=1 Tax=Melipona bicolor TaxID=60889 RepID=A0AA40GE90_9HYME|nr:hypothetical protein K0M31_000807 [Melipona bicolor]